VPLLFLHGDSSVHYEDIGQRRSER
jgi:hypothetical protein